MNSLTNYLLFLALSVFFLSSCSRNPTNNPFDAHYNVSKKKLEQQGYYELPSPDEYWGYEKTFNDRYRVGYLYYADAPRINGKDFTYFIDTLLLDVDPSEISSREGLALVDSFHQSFWPKAELEGTLLLLDCELVAVEGDEVTIYSSELDMPIALLKQTDVQALPSGQVRLVRNLNGFIANPYFGDPPLGLQILEGVLIGTVIVAASIAEEEAVEEDACE